MRIGILQTDHLPEDAQAQFGDLDVMFHRFLDGNGFSFETYDVADMQLPEGPQDADGWLITGAHHAAYDPLPWIGPLEGLVRDIRGAGRPMVGICFGHQIIAQALGGQVEKFRDGWCFGRETYQISGADLPLFACHQDQVVDLPPDARIVGHSNRCAHAMLAYGDRILTLQPHPEFDAGFMTYLADLYAADGSVPAEMLADAAPDLGKPTGKAEMATTISQVFKGK